MLKHLKLDVSNSKLPFTARSLRAIQNKFSKLPKPAFEVNKLNFKSLKKQLQPYQKYKNIIIIANGGSRTSAVA
jgi:hypothetical protein